ncbi:MAG: hypothetical protein LLF87_01565 [Eubacteriales bacterium]|nr:hypothetical protein [Eubacteriales bacterium]
METTGKANVEYAAQASTPELNGDVRLTLGEDALTVTAPLDAAELPYASIRSLARENYGVTVNADGGAYRFSKMGNQSEAFYDALFAAYNKKVRKALFVSGTPLLKAQGEYRFEERGAAGRGSAPIEVYKSCVLFLPPNDEARRVPLCFVTALEKAGFSLTLRIGDEESYAFSKLGYDTEPFAQALEKLLRDLREKALAAAKELDPSLSPAQAAAVARLTPEGAAAPIGTLRGIAPSFASALERELSLSRSAREFEVLRSLSDPQKIYVGRKKRFDAPESEPDDTMLFMIAPGRSEKTAAVEFAVAEGETAATFLYRFDGGFDAFARAFNRALEAISFHREAIRLSEAELEKPQYADAAMAVRRNASLRFIRAAFAGRVIHASQESWAQGVKNHLGP